MKVLKTFDVNELLKRQELLDRQFDKKKTVRKRTEDRIIIAVITELGELFQELKGEWNYWKNTAKPHDKQKVLEELSDYLHFVLSYMNETGVEYKHPVQSLDYSVNIMITAVPIDIDNLLKNFLINFINGNYFSVFVNINVLLHYLGVSIEDFLKVHHMVWERNMGVRSKIEY